ncbi:MAG: BON domain-containing protein, partial [Planctomycetota bacterium]
GDCGRQDYGSAEFGREPGRAWTESFEWAESEPWRGEVWRRRPEPREAEARGWRGEYRDRPERERRRSAEQRGRTWGGEDTGWGEGWGPGGGAPSVGERTRHFFGMGPKGYTRSDERIREDLCDRLMADDCIDASEIELAVKSGEVTLKGTVTDRWQKYLAEEVAERTMGVRDVINEIRVRRPEPRTGQSVQRPSVQAGEQHAGLVRAPGVDRV